MMTPSSFFHHLPDITLSAMQADRLTVSGTTLTWFPFFDRGYSLVEPSTKTSLSRQLLL
jgi:hypothetical protein